MTTKTNKQVYFETKT